VGLTVVGAVGSMTGRCEGSGLWDWLWTSVNVCVTDWWVGVFACASSDVEECRWRTGWEL
jgi:hypothetical protein